MKLKKGGVSMLIGTFRHQVDEKKRMRVPSKLKESLGVGFIITKGTNGCLFAFSQDSFNEEVVEKTKNLSMFDAEVQKPLRILMSSAFETEEDNQGRILIPQELRTFASITKKIVFVGVGSRVEIWAEEVWDKYNEGTDFDEATKTLAGLGV
ncbi:MAG: division/cell wall cluster transcriptional repressor MraZ [Clostridia bacterium]|nr:division/cell wall cluster transcriptional repressor MraZ [Clostridia bacterium]